MYMLFEYIVNKQFSDDQLIMFKNKKFATTYCFTIMDKTRRDIMKNYILGEAGNNEFEDELIRDSKGPSKDITTHDYQYLYLITTVTPKHSKKYTLSFKITAT